MGFDKLLADLGGKPVLQRSIEAFITCPDVTDITVVCPQERYDRLELECANKVIQRVNGGIDRHDSVASGLAALPEDISYIAVHDGARPLISKTQIHKVLTATKEHGAAASARPITETVKRANDQHAVCESVDRENLWLMETPQIFRADLLLDAYRRVAESGTRVTDEVSAMELIGQAVHLVSNDTVNPKITYPADIEQAKIFLT